MRGLPTGLYRVSTLIEGSFAQRYVKRHAWAMETAESRHLRWFRGATAYPRARGVWRDDERGGELKHEEPMIITCYADRVSLKNSEVQRALRGFLHQLGRETDQGEVGIVIDGRYYGITKFDSTV